MMMSHFGVDVIESLVAPMTKAERRELAAKICDEEAGKLREMARDLVASELPIQADFCTAEADMLSVKAKHFRNQK